GGRLLETGRLGVIYALHAASYLLALSALAYMRYAGTVAPGRGRTTRADMAEGFRFTFSTHMIRSTLLLDLFATLLGSARPLLPIVADQVLGVGAGGYCFLATAQPLRAVRACSLASLRRDI